VGVTEKEGIWPFLTVAELVSRCIIDLSVFALCRPLPPPIPPSPAATTPATAAAEELQELLLVRQEELTRREEALPAWEEKAGISKKALDKISADLDAERAKAEATQQEYLNKMAAHTTHAKQSLNPDKMLGEKNV
jgi:hypothetical protein